MAPPEPSLAEDVPVCHGSVQVRLPEHLEDREDYVILMKATDGSFTKVSEKFWVSPSATVDIADDMDLEELIQWRMPCVICHLAFPILFKVQALTEVQNPPRIADWVS
jgi:hypothetical protein